MEMLISVVEVVVARMLVHLLLQQEVNKELTVVPVSSLSLTHPKTPLSVV
jgi:hypothetical protein